MWFLIILVVAAIILFVVLAINKRHLLDAFNSGNVIVFGKKGKGKDLLFQYVINARKKKCYSNIDYGKLSTHIDIKDLNCDPNDFNRFIDAEVVIVEKKLEEKRDAYISDGGISLSSAYDGLLKYKYKSFPVFYALSRHLLDMNIHINTQSIERVWKLLREQADNYVMANGVIKLGKLFIIKYRIYDRYESANRQLDPIKNRPLNKFAHSEADQYHALYGNITNGFVVLSLNRIYFDTRAYHQTVYGFRAPKNKNKITILIEKLFKHKPRKQHN